MRTIYTVYIHQNKENGKRYVGITSCETKVRWKNGFGYSETLPIGRAFRKYGWDGFTHEIVANGLSESEAKELEIKLIAELQTQNPLFGYNICAGGEGVTGWHPTEETRRKISVAQSGRFGSANSNFGHKWTDEMKAKASEQHRNISDGTRRKISESAKQRVGERNSFFGKHHSAETKERLAQHRWRAVEMLDNYGVVLQRFPSINNASESTGINKGAISNCCRGKSKTSGGYIWRYAA